MARDAARPTGLRGAVFRGSDAIARRLLTRRQLDGSAWRRLFRDVYADADLPDTHRLRCRGAALILPPGVVLTGRSAACLRGMPVAEPYDPVHVLSRSPASFRAVGFRSCQTTHLPPGHLLPGTPGTPGDPGEPGATGASRSAWEIAGEPDLVEAVVALDVLLRRGYVRSRVMDLWVAASPRSRAARAVRLTDGRAESPPESRLRVRLSLAGLPAPIPQHDVFAGTEFVARLDLAWPERRIACEYDGAWHAAAGQFSRDRERLNRVHSAGWTIFHVTAADLADPTRFATLVRQLGAALRAP